MPYIDLYLNGELLTAATLRTNVAPLAPTVNIARALELFSDDPDLAALPIVENARPIGIVDRRAMVEQFARPYTRELLGRKPVSAFMDSNVLLIDGGMRLSDLGRLYMQTSSSRTHTSFIVTDDGNYAGLGCGHKLMRLLTEHTQARLFHLAHSDALTGLPNRLLFMDRLKQATAQAARSERLVAIMLLDFDRFKVINDTLGHSLGDQLLIRIAERLVGCVRACDTVARLGGDEFTLLIPEVTHVGQTEAVAEKVLEELRRPFTLNDHEVFIMPSMGVAIYPFSEDIERLIVDADTAMYAAKNLGGNSFQFYTFEMRTGGAKRLTMESALRRAVERNELLLHYQPQLDLETGRIIGAEALIRWRHPEHGLVSPADFIPLAEETGLILPIGAWALREACTQARAWQRNGLPTLRIAVNLSPRQFYQKDFAATVVEILDQTGLAAHDLELELTEGTLMQNTAGTVAALTTLHQAGVQIAMDDFGTGYSSLSYLKRFPIDRVKIDRSFVADITTNPDDAAITDAIIAMTRSLGLRVIAEGVETIEQLRFLAECGCHEIQGFYISRPLPAEEFASFVFNAVTDNLENRPAVIDG